MNCLKCGTELRENAIFCDKCGEKVNKKKIKWKEILILLGMAVIVALLILSFFVGNDMEEKDDEESSVAIENVELSYEEELRNKFFERNFTNGGYIFGAVKANGESLLRGSKVFDGADIVVDGTVDSILPSESNDQFYLVVNNTDYYHDNVGKVAVIGKYPEDGTRYVVGDHVWFQGEYAGISMFQLTNGAHIEYAVVKECEPVDVYGYSMEEVSSIVGGIFEEEVELNYEEDEVESFYTYQRIAGQDEKKEKWCFHTLGGAPAVSLDGSEANYFAFFDEDYSHYLLQKVDYNAGKLKLRYRDITGKELWEKEYEGDGERLFCQFHKGKIYIYHQGEISILNSNDGTELAKPLFVSNINSMQIVGDMVVLKNIHYGDNAGEQDTMMALGLDGKIQWKYRPQDGFSLDMMEYALVEKDYIFCENKTEENGYTGERNYVTKYLRMNTETGEIVAEVMN